MLRYGLTFEDIEVLDEYILFISEEEIVVKKSIYELKENQLSAIKRYINFLHHMCLLNPHKKRFHDLTFY